MELLESAEISRHSLLIDWKSIYQPRIRTTPRYYQASLWMFFKPDQNFHSLSFHLSTYFCNPRSYSSAKLITFKRLPRVFYTNALKRQDSFNTPRCQITTAYSQELPENQLIHHSTGLGQEFDWHAINLHRLLWDHKIMLEVNVHEVKLSIRLQYHICQSSNQ